MRSTLRTFVIAGLAGLMVMLGGCDLTSLNDDPNQPTRADTPKLLTNAQVDIANQYWQDYSGGFWVRYAQYWTTNQYTDADRYNFKDSRPQALNDLWENYYLALNNLQEIRRLNGDSDVEGSTEPSQATRAFGEPKNQIAVAKVMQAWVLKTMTDMFGPIPVKEALKGRSVLEGNSGAFTPAYDSQKDVYLKIIELLTEANDQITATDASALASGDQIYGGDMGQWKKFANALKMRAAITLADKRSDSDVKVEQWLEEAISEGTFTSNADNALFPFSTSPPHQNPFYENNEVQGRDDWAAPNSIVKPMKETDDPRLTEYFTTTPDGDVEGFPYGLSESAAQSLFTSGTFSRPSKKVANTADAPAILMLYDEVLFIKAEAQLRGLNVQGISKSGQQLYEEAIEANAEYWGVPESEARDFAQNDAPNVNSSNYKQVLGTQKWIAQYLQGVPGWTTFRRLDFEGVLQPPAGDPGQGKFGRSFAVRMKYPSDEFSLNEKNLTSDENGAIPNLLGGDGASTDNQGVLLWWDTTPPPSPAL